MRPGWETKRIGDVCHLATGGTPSRSNAEFFNGDIRWLVSGDIHRGEITECEGRISEEGLRNSNAKMLPLNSVLIALNGQGKTRGTVAILRVEATCNQSLVSISPKDPTRLLPEFLYTNLHGRYQEIRRLTGDDDKDRRGLNMDLIRRIEVPVAPATEQRRIVSVLNEACAGIASAKANAEKNLKNGREVFERHLNLVFAQRGVGWMKKRLEEIGKTQTGSTPKTSDRDNYGDAIPFIKPADFLANGSLGYDNEGLSKRGMTFARIVPAGSILMVCIGATIGKCAYSDRAVTTNQQINSLTPADGSSNRFLYYQMLTEDFQRSVMRGSGQATLPIINKSKWSALSVWLPPTVAEQKEIAAQLGTLAVETERLESIYRRKLAALDELKRSLLHEAFSGRL